MAQAAVERPRHWAYLNGGAGDEITLRANRSAWDALQLQPRVLRDLAGGHTRSELLGRTLAHPILLAPIAYQRLAHADGELASAYAAAAQQGGVMVLSAQSSVADGGDCASLSRRTEQRAAVVPALLARRPRASCCSCCAGSKRRASRPWC